MITDKLNTEFWIITDTHLIADCLHDNGTAFQEIQKTSQGKDLAYQEIALRAFCQLVNDKKPAAIIVTGDVTFNGELLSAKKFQEIFSALTATRLLVIPGNHDIYDGWARIFKEEQQLYTEQISPTDWKRIFSSSYECALSQDHYSLGYSVQLNPQYLLLLLDSNIYGKREAIGAPPTEGQISEEQIVWLEKQLTYAKKHHLRPLLFMHHNLYVHNPAVNRGFVLNNAPLLRQLCKDYDIKAAFSGHIHAQNIVGPQDRTPTTEIVTSSFCSYDQAYGIVKLDPTSLTYQRQTFEMTPYLSAKQRQNPLLTNFHQYLKNIQLRNLSTNSKQKDSLANQKSSRLNKINQLFIEMNYNYFTGHNHLSEKQLHDLYASPEFKALVADHPRFSKYLKTLYDTTDHSNLSVTLNY
ncbi:metallophosphoesterase [Lactobacillus sp.]|uniref:metallophosphoesterase family protein n=1 Tax=Lactobacillus sp. TaxID=1591 RepID=UPI0025D74111|nr:metallophosphoesterase [Lactobacillus sp.]MCO6532572.1 metallophosphoesterase [Lactobacillus sp.]